MPWNNVTGETRRLYGGRHELAPRQKTFVKLRDLICRAISSLVFNISLSNLATLLISKRSFWPCWGIFANWSQYGTSLRKFDGQTLKKPWKGLFETSLFLVCNHVTGRSCWLTKQNKNTLVPGGRKTLSFLSTKMVPWRQLTYMICSPKFDQTHKFKLF